MNGKRHTNIKVRKWISTYEGHHDYTVVEHTPPVSRRKSQLLAENKIKALAEEEDFNVFGDDHNHKKL